MGWYFNFNIIKGINWFQICLQYTYVFQIHWLCEKCEKNKRWWKPDFHISIYKIDHSKYEDGDGVE